MSDRQVIGTGICHDCGALVQVAVNKNRRAYYYCDGREDPEERQCGAHFRWSLKSSRTMVAEAAAASDPPHWGPTDDDEAEMEPSIEPDPEDPTPDPAEDGNPDPADPAGTGDDGITDPGGKRRWRR